MLELTTNPFKRGFDHATPLWSRRALAILPTDGAPLIHRDIPVDHPYLSDDVWLGREVWFTDTHAGAVAYSPGTIDQNDVSHGVVENLVFGLYATETGEPRHLADAPSAQAAGELLEAMRFTTGHYSRSWEISTDHLPGSAWDYLATQAMYRTPTGMMFEVFPVTQAHDCLVIGIKLVATPWTTCHLKSLEEHPVSLRKEQLKADVPAPLVDVLHLAAQADVRFLVFDPDAGILDGLPVYEE